jgi:hypothetical protein
MTNDAKGSEQHSGLAAGPQDSAGSVWFRAGAALLLVVLPVLLWSVLCTAASAGVPWNAARLAPSFALAQGLPIYALRDSGQQLGWFYGPGFVIWNLPVTLLSGPTPALFAAGVWNILTWLVPVALVLRAAGVAAGWMTGVGAALAGGLLLGNSVTRYGFYFIHVDALCVGAGLLACVFLHRAVQPGKSAWLYAATAALLLAIWTKQLAVMLVPGMLIWLWRSGHRPLASRWVFQVLVGGAISAISVFVWFGTEEVIFDLWLVHSRNPWRGGFALLLTELGRLLASAWVWLPLGLLVGWLHRTGPRKMPTAASSLVGLLGWCALLQLPTGLLALLKAGGGLNSLHPVHYLLVMFLIVAFHAFARPVAVAARAGVLWVAALVVPLGNATVFALNPGSHWKIPQSHERLLAMAREQPGRYYFPWNPLVTIIADRRVQPLDDALYCLWNVGLEIPAEKVRAAVPRNPIILYEEPAQSHFALRYFKPGTDTQLSSTHAHVP